MHANREYISLTRLAEILYEEGDIVRAYNYLNRSIEDASYCKALQRMDMAAPMLSIVNTSYKRMNSMWLKSLSGISLVLLLMAVALLVLIHYLRAQRKRLAMANSELTSSRLRARMMVTEDWEPELPPVPISMGIKAVSAT